MSFSNMLKILKEKNKDTIVLIKLGVFYTATGSDAVFLSNQLGLKCICFKNQVCKIGIPEEKIETYLNKLKKLNITYVVYDFNSRSESLVEKDRNSKGNYHKEKNENRNCLICKGIRCYKKDKYMSALKKLMEEESKNKESLNGCGY